MIYLGSHSSFDNAQLIAQDIKNKGGNIIQLYLAHHNVIDFKYSKKLNELNKFLKKNNMKCVVHGSYMYNFARYWDEQSIWINQAIAEIKLASKINALGVIFHFGKHLDLSLKEAYNNMYSSLLYVHNKTKKYDNVKIILETSTGQGTELCYKLDDFSYFYKKFSLSTSEIKNRFKICIDTCHVFSAGYDLNSIKHSKLFIDTFNELIGIENVFIIHLNNSKVNCGSNIDRHASLDLGYINTNSLIYLFNFFTDLNKYIILETPNLSYRYEIPLLLDNKKSN